MAEYIERGAAIRAIKTKYRPENSVAQNRLLALAIHDVLTSPAADVAEVRHGRWMRCREDGVATCSECRNTESEDDAGRFCRYCGARMDGGAGDG